MTKKLTIQRGKNLQGGGLSNLIGEQDDPKEQQVEKNHTIKTFNIFNEDFDFLNRYIRFMGFKENKRYTQKLGLSDALGLLKEKYPEI